MLLGKFGVGRSGRVSGDCLLNGQLLRGKIFLLSVVALARDCRVQAAERSHRFHRIVSAEGERHTAVREFSPRVRVRRADRAQPVLRPVHVGQQMAGLHRGDHLQLAKARDLRGIGDLVVLNPQT